MMLPVADGSLTGLPYAQNSFNLPSTNVIHYTKRRVIIAMTVKVKPNLPTVSLILFQKRLSMSIKL